ncbi:sporulation protein YunB [Ihubacter sp. rT4E-8]|uniref:sporulation protein YunB n=1 Tax=Ihubacter sp. rT4E-8 TaxID=3242369 RepID=UPI003CFA8ED9
MSRNRYAGSMRFTKKIAISAALIGMGIILLMTGLKQQIGPNIDAVSKLKAKGVVNRIINETIHEEFSSGNYEERLFNVKKGKDGKVQIVQANTPVINEMVSGFSAALQKKYEDMKAVPVKLNYGTLMGSKLLSQTDFGLDIKILPMAVTSCDFETAFETQGINQTKYKVYIILKSSVRVLEPFSADNIQITSKMLICELVIVGEVPDSYVNVPEEDILDVT